MLALIAGSDPVRVGVALLVMSRRPMRNLVGYWLGTMATGIATFVGLLTVLRSYAPMLAQHVAAAAASPTARHVQIACGVLALPVAAMIAMGFSTRQRVPAGAAGGGSSAPSLLPSTPPVFSRLSGRAQGVLMGGSLWVAVVVGLVSAPQPLDTLLGITAILASGAAVDTEVSAAIVFIVIMLGLIEIPLVCYLFMPAKTEAAMVQLRTWLVLQRRRIIAVIVAVAGVLMLASGVGSV